MCVYHFHAAGYDQGAYESCVDDAAAQHVSFRICMELSANTDRFVLITATNDTGSEVVRVPRLARADLEAFEALSCTCYLARQDVSGLDCD